jgi:glutathione reductase (NADPH)
MFVRSGGEIKILLGKWEMEGIPSVDAAQTDAARDAAGIGPPLTPVSSHDARTVAANLLDGTNRHRPDY